MRRRQKEEEHDNTDRWLISYADFITLMFTFFAALYALSSMDTAKMEKFSGSLRQSFKIIEQPIPLYEEKNKAIVEDVQKVIKGAEGVSVRSEPRGVVVTFSDAALFASGSAEIKPEAFGVLEKMSKFVNTMPKRITIEGHTDNVPVSGGKYSSNWELSTGRAASILHFFIAKGLDPNRFSIAGYAEYRPVAVNDTEEGRKKNRRVELVIGQ
ncbi:MAG: OmpA family protein [Nitrospirae bacterium]|nr:OmpA family protein [Nitrospirota bacterium]MCL5237261.1 OmpA family protein [Nitrospirota bacterium]